MSKFGKKSEQILESCHHLIRKVLAQAIQYYDFSVISGYREPKEQFEIFKSGRKFENGKWSVEDINKIRTYCDGYEKLSLHNYEPALAVDLAPYPIDWNDHKRFYEMAGGILTITKQMNIPLFWGGHFKGWKDLPHFYLIMESKIDKSNLFNP